MKIKKKRGFVYLLCFLVILSLIIFKPTGKVVYITTGDTPITKRTIPCISVSNIQKEINIVKREDIAYKAPKGYSTIINPFSVKCDGDIELTVSIPDNFIDVKALRCRKDECYPADIFNINALECGNFVKEVFREAEYLEPRFMTVKIIETEIDYGENKIKSGKNEIEFYRDIENSVTMNMPSQPIKEAKNPSLKIIGTPMVIKLSNIVPLNSTVTTPYIEKDYIEKDSYSLYVKNNDLWNYIGGNLDKENKVVRADIVNINQYAYDNEIIFAVMGILCTDCLSSSFKRIYNNGKDAIVLVHGFMSSPKTYNEFIDDVILTEQSFQLWTFGYPTTRDIKQNANELAQYLEANKNEYDNIYIIGHSLGGIIAQQALFLSANDNLEYLKKVKKIILVATPNEGSPTVKVYENLINQIINLGKYRVYNPRNIVQDLISGVITPRVEGIDYYVISGAQGYILTKNLFDSVNDGIINVKSAQHIGDSYINNRCEDYWELHKTHTELIDDVLPRKIIEKMVSEEKDEISVLGSNQYFKLVDKCFPGDKYIFIGREIEKERVADPTGCSCGNGFCGVDEDEISCPSDCEKPRYNYWIFLIIIIIIIFYIIIKKETENKGKKKKKKKKNNKNYKYS